MDNTWEDTVLFTMQEPIIGMLDGEANALISKSNSGFVVNSGNYIIFQDYCEIN